MCVRAQRKYTSRSDVWSFGVTLWELLSLARRRPYDALSDAHLLAELRATARTARTAGGGGWARLARPRTCPREIYDLLAECWHVDDARRPTFREIDMFLTRKNMGYRPADRPLTAGNDNLAAAVDVA